MSSHIYDPAVAPTKPIQHISDADNARFQNFQPTSRFDTTYRAEFINRIRNHEQQFTKPTRQFKNSFSQYSVLPPISNDNRSEVSDRKSVVSENQQQQQPYPDQEVPSNESLSTMNYPTETQNYNQQQTWNNENSNNNYYNNITTTSEDTYLPNEPILLTDFEENRLAEQIRVQLGAAAVDRLKLFYQELAAYDTNATGFVHYSNIQTLTYQLGISLAEDTLRFAMCKFVSPNQARGYVNYDDMVRYFGKCLSSVYPNQYSNQQAQQQDRNSPQKPRTAQNQFPTNEDQFDPDERQIRVLLKQNLKNFDLSGTIDFDKLTRELSQVDRNQSGILNRQQIEEVVYKVRIPFQRSLIYQILEKHCRSSARLYDWRVFVQYLKEQVYDLKQIRDQSSSIYSQLVPSRHQLLDDLQREFHEKDRLRIIDRYIANNAGVRLESTHPTAWFTRFLRLANALYTHRTSSNVSQDFVLPMEEARRLFRAYNHVWDLKIDEFKVQKIFENCSRNGRVLISDALKQLAN